eukprot:jgi/Botrbrau1/13539/Bobra.0347s0023.1
MFYKTSQCTQPRSTCFYNIWMRQKLRYCSTMETPGYPTTLNGCSWKATLTPWSSGHHFRSTCQVFELLVHIGPMLQSANLQARDRGNLSSK